MLSSTQQDRNTIGRHVTDRGLGFEDRGDLLIVKWSRPGFIPANVTNQMASVRRAATKLGYRAHLSQFSGGFFVRLVDRLQTTEERTIDNRKART